MWYAPFLRTRRALTVYFIAVAGVTLLSLIVHVYQTATKPQDDFGAFTVDGWPFLSACGVLGAILATILGLSLAAENDGHLELAWTKPVSRERYALTIFAIDAAAIAVAQLATFAIGVGALDLAAGHSAFVFSGPVSSHIGVHVTRNRMRTETRTLAAVPSREASINVGEEAPKSLAFLVFPLCVYAWITALTASLKRNRGTIAGVFWPAVLIFAALETVPSPPIQAIMGVVNRINPIVDFDGSSDFNMHLVGFGSIVVLLGLAVLQWRRLEA